MKTRSLELSFQRKCIWSWSDPRELVVQPDCPAGAPGVRSGAARGDEGGGGPRIKYQWNHPIAKPAAPTPPHGRHFYKLMSLYNITSDLSTRYEAISKHVVQTRGRCHHHNVDYGATNSPIYDRFYVTNLFPFTYSGSDFLVTGDFFCGTRKETSRGQE